MNSVLCIKKIYAFSQYIMEIIVRTHCNLKKNMNFYLENKQALYNLKHQKHNRSILDSTKSRN